MTDVHDAITFEIKPPAVRLGKGRLDVDPDIVMEALMAALDKLHNALDSPPLRSLEEMEKRHIKRVIENTDTYKEAADRLGISEKTLWVKRQKYQMFIYEDMGRPKKVTTG